MSIVYAYDEQGNEYELKRFDTDKEADTYCDELDWELYDLNGKRWELWIL